MCFIKREDFSSFLLYSSSTLECLLFAMCCISVYQVNSPDGWPWTVLVPWSASPPLWKKSNLIYMNIYVAYNLLSKWFHNSIIHKTAPLGAGISFASCLFERIFFWHFLNYKLANKNFFPLDFKANTTIKTLQLDPCGKPADTLFSVWF